MIVSPCNVVTDKRECVAGADINAPGGLIFREDSYDPKTRLKRGRVYKAFDAPIQQWFAANERDGGDFYTYSHHSLWAQYYRESRATLYMIIGDKHRFSVWKVVGIEVTINREEVLTLKSLSTYGILPELHESDIPESDLSFIKNKLTPVVEEMYTASAESMVDYCREAASAVIGTFLGSPTKDLGALVRGLGDAEKKVAQNAAGIINLFHPRRKASETRARGLRAVAEEDAQLAVQCLGLILVELGWARW